MNGFCHRVYGLMYGLVNGFLREVNGMNGLRAYTPTHPRACMLVNMYGGVSNYNYTYHSSIDINHSPNHSQSIHLFLQSIHLFTIFSTEVHN